MVLLGLVGTGARAATGVFAEGARLGVPFVAPASSPPTAAPPATAETMSAPPTVAAGERPDKQVEPTVVRVKVPDSGPGTYASANLEGHPAGQGGTVVNFDVRREKGVPVDVNAAAKTVQSVLNDPRSWRAGGKWRFKLVDSSARADLHIYITTPKTTDRLCAPLLTRGEVSCQNGNLVVLNAKRWVMGAETYGKDVTNYRRYLVNHEVGHSLGYQHTNCEGNGKRAGVMMQQTKGLEGCRANPWPYPQG